MEVMTAFIFWVSKITIDSDCSHEIKKCLFLRRKAMTNLDSLLKRSDITAYKGLSSKRYSFPLIMYGSAIWIVKKAECQRIDGLNIFWRRLLIVSQTARRSNPSILKKSTLIIHWKDWCWSWSSNILAICWEELTHRKRTCCWERLKTEAEGGNRG